MIQKYLKASRIYHNEDDFSRPGGTSYPPTGKVIANTIHPSIPPDVNDNPPEFSRKFYHAVVSEASAVGVEVLKVLATSRDSGLNAEVTYFFSAGNELGHFSIDAKTGLCSSGRSSEIG